MANKPFLWWYIGPILGLPMVALFSPALATAACLGGLFVTFIAARFPLPAIGLANSESAIASFFMLALTLIIVTGISVSW